MDALTPELVLKLRRPSDVALSADGSRIAFAVSASFREQGKPIETRLWTGEVDGELEPRRARFAAALLAGRVAARLRRPTAGTRGACRSGSTTASSARSRARSRTSTGRRTELGCSCSQPISGPTAPARDSATKIEEAGAEAAGSEGLPAREVLAAALARRRRDRRDAGRHAGGRQRLRARLGRREGGGGLHATSPRRAPGTTPGSA